MEPSAIVLMIVSIVVVWGGLVVNILKLRYRRAPHEVLEAAREEALREKTKDKDA